MRITILSVLSIFLFSCETSPHKTILMYVDLSTSFDEDAMEGQITKIVKMVQNLPFETTLELYPMDGGVYTEPIFTYIRNEKANLYDDREQERKQLETMSDSLEQYLHGIYKGKYNIIDKQFQSCIITSFENIYQNLKFRDDLGNIHVVVMSDMIEQCGESGAGSIFMCSKTRSPDLLEINKKILDDYNPNFNLQELIDNRIHIVVTSNHDTQNRCLKQQEQKGIWMKIFEKIGFSDPRDVYYSNRMPDFEAI